MANSYTFKGLLTKTGWIENAHVSLNDFGCVKSITSQKTTSGELVNGYALPGFQNAHSHAFQYAMAGLAELHEGTGTPDDFWSWRNAMYNLALTVSPQHLEDIAAMLYAEMLRHGYTAVAEFHYLHHDINGKPYSNLAEHGGRLISAAEKTGIKITLVPMFYQKGGFGKPAEDKQKRFISPTLDSYYKLLESSKQAATHYKDASVGIGIHSLRAVEGDDIKQLCRDLDSNIPFHIHVSEQLKEIDDCMAYYGKRPVEWLLENCHMSDQYHLVHATHLNTAEVKGIAKAQANVVLCPSTEGNLGDGLFSFSDYKELGGKWSIGTDSHVGLNPFEELRLLDYGQRLTTHKRNSFYETGKGDSGFNAIQMAWFSGKKAMGDYRNDFFEIGKPFDAVIMDAKAPLIASASLKHLCNTFVYSSDVANILGTIVNGEWLVKQGGHRAADMICSRFLETMKFLGTRI